MAMSSSWVDELLGRLAVRYGEAFTRQYTAAGVDAQAVRADWAEVLDGVSAESIRYALEYLPADKAPNALQFRALCRNAPRKEPEHEAITHKGSKPHPRVAAALRGLAEKLRIDSQNPRRWAKADGSGDAQQTPQAIGDFTPIADHLLPPAMRNGGIARGFAAELVAKHEAGENVDAERLSAAKRLLSRSKSKERTEAGQWA
jgi:hypothetical protein